MLLSHNVKRRSRAQTLAGVYVAADGKFRLDLFGPEQNLKTELRSVVEERLRSSHLDTPWWPAVVQLTSPSSSVLADGQIHQFIRYVSCIQQSSCSGSLRGGLSLT